MAVRDNARPVAPDLGNAELNDRITAGLQEAEDFLSTLR